MERRERKNYLNSTLVSLKNLILFFGPGVVAYLALENSKGFSAAALASIGITVLVIVAVAAYGNG